MKHLLVTAVMLTGVPQAHAQFVAGRDCAHPTTRNVEDNRAFLALRAVDIVDRARASGWRTDPMLPKLIAQNATIQVGSGDVIEGLEEGVPGIRMLASRITGLTYRYALSAGFIDGPFNPCADQLIELEFDDSASGTRMAVSFVFREEVLVSAGGYASRFVEGRLEPID